MYFCMSFLSFLSDDNQYFLLTKQKMRVDISVYRDVITWLSGFFFLPFFLYIYMILPRRYLFRVVIIRIPLSLVLVLPHRHCYVIRCSFCMGFCIMIWYCCAPRRNFLFYNLGLRDWRMQIKLLCRLSDATGTADL